MNLNELLQLAFDAGTEYGKSQEGGTIDQMPSDNGVDFFTWSEEHKDAIMDTVIKTKFIHICTSLVNGHKTIHFSETKDWPYSPFIWKSVVGTFVNWEIIELYK
jgi:hypothetical protein